MFSPGEGSSFSVPRVMLVRSCFGFSQYAASRVLAGGLAWCPIPGRCVRTTVVFFLSPSLDEMSRLLQIEEPVSVQAFTTERAVEAFAEGVLRTVSIGP